MDGPVRHLGANVPVGRNRRELIALLGGAAVAWPVAARAQQRERIRRIGFLTSLGPDDPVSLAYLAGLLQGLQESGWVIGRNVRMDPRWAATNVELKRRYASELVGLAPDVIVATGDSNTGPLQEATRTVPIVFALVPDPVGAGFVANLARPGGNATGFTNFEYGMTGKWPELLKQIAPGVTRVAVLRDPTVRGGIAQLGAIHAVAPSLQLEASPIDVRNPAEIERGITEFSRTPNGGLIVLPNGLAQVNRELIIALAARHRLPAVYPFRFFVIDGGLISYGPDDVDQLRRVAGYVDRILRGDKPGDLPVQNPTKYDLLINLKAARALGLEISPSILARADEVIE